MSLQKSNRKFSNSEASAGELPAMELRGVSQLLRDLRKNPRLRCPFKFNGSIARKVGQ